jgi:hypothetical protein
MCAPGLIYNVGGGGGIRFEIKMPCRIYLQEKNFILTHKKQLLFDLM